MTLHEVVPWHITKFPLGVPPPLQLGSELLNVHVPITTPLLRMPVVVVVPLEVPETVPLRASVLLLELDLIVKVNGPVTVSVEVVVNVVVPEIV